MNKRLFSKERRAVTLVMAAVFLCILVLGALTPMAADDFSYSFSWADNSRITRVSQIIPSMAVHRQLTNGRVVTHALVQLLLMRPRGPFVILNALNALLLCYLFYRYIRRLPGPQAGLLLLIGALLMWNYATDFQCLFLWLDGSVNYSWGMSLILLWLWPFSEAWLEEREDSRKSKWKTVLFLFLSFVAGAWSENSSLAAMFIALLLILMCAFRDKKIRPLLVAGLVMAALGYVFLMSAPATAGRAGGTDMASIANRIKQMIADCRELLLAPWMIYAGSLALCLLYRTDKRRILLSLVFFVAGLASLSAFIFAYYFNARHCCFTLFFTVLATLILLSSLMEKGRKLAPSLLTAVMCVLFVFNFSAGVLDIAVGYGKSRERAAMIRAAQEAGETEITLPLYPAATQYCVSFILFPDAEEWPNYSLASYYGFDQVYGEMESEMESVD